MRSDEDEGWPLQQSGVLFRVEREDAVEHMEPRHGRIHIGQGDGVPSAQRLRAGERLELRLVDARAAQEAPAVPPQAAQGTKWAQDKRNIRALMGKAEVLWAEENLPAPRIINRMARAWGLNGTASGLRLSPSQPGA